MKRIAIASLLMVVALGCHRVVEKQSAGGSDIGSELPKDVPPELAAVMERIDQPLKIAEGKPCPPFTYKTIEGKTVRLEDYRGRALLVDVFSPS